MPDALTPRQKIVLAALAGAPGAAFAPVQIQKFFFLIDKNIAGHIGGKQFDFQPYDYGPYDPRVYRELEALEGAGLAQISSSASLGDRRYQLTVEGHKTGEEMLSRLPETARDYIVRISEWIRKQSFAQLVGAIYHEYPAMKANSIFRS